LEEPILAAAIPESEKMKELGSDGGEGGAEYDIQTDWGWEEKKKRESSWKHGQSPRGANDLQKEKKTVGRSTADAKRFLGKRNTPYRTSKTIGAGQGHRTG